jgi:microsomal epoxide hydrolase
MSKPFQQLPNEPTIPLEPFSANIPDSVLEDLERRIKDTPEIRDTYETLGRAEKDGEDLGVKKGWVNEALDTWTGGFDWYVPCVSLQRLRFFRRSIEKRVNSFANYTAEIEHDGNKYQVHFMGLFSEKKDAQPIIMTHGWPGEPSSIRECHEAELSRIFPRVFTSDRIPVQEVHSRDITCPSHRTILDRLWILFAPTP